MKSVVLLVLLMSCALGHARVYKIESKEFTDIKISMSLVGGKILQENPQFMIVDLNNIELFDLRMKFQSMKINAYQQKTEQLAKR